jgi:hypothetical protein
MNTPLGQAVALDFYYLSHRFCPETDRQEQYHQGIGQL